MSRRVEAAATILDVARLAGVSRTTVSRATNEPDSVSTETLRRVRAAATELQYTPSTVARGLRSGRTGMIALLVGDIAQPFHGALARAVVAAARRKDLGVVLFDLGHSTAQLQSVLEQLPRQGVDGLIIATADDIATGGVQSALDECRASGLSVVLGVSTPTHPGSAADGIGAVHVDHAGAVRMAIEALRTAGHTRPTLLLGDPDSPLTQRMSAGADGASVTGTAYDFESAFAAVRDIDEHTDALVVATTPMALGALAGLAQSGRHMPVVVCEEVPLASQVTPALSTCAADPNDIGHEMVRLLYARISAHAVEARTLRPQLIRRDSF